MADRQHNAQPEEINLDGLKILIADDNEYNRTVARDTLLSRSTAVIVEAGDGREALDLVIQHDFDIVLMDVQMPVLDGYAATRAIRKLKGSKSKVPVIAITASIKKSDLDKCKEAGMNGYIPKPFQIAELISTIAVHTGRGFTRGTVKSSDPREEQQNKEAGQGFTNLAYLERFCEGDARRKEKYIRLFLDSIPGFTFIIEQALEHHDHLEIAAQIHGFKTKLGMMGMSRTQEIGQKIEAACRLDKLNDGVRRDVKEFLNQVKEAGEELSRQIG